VGLGPFSRAGALALALLVVGCVAVGDALTGPYVSFTLLYLAPIAFGTWFLSLGAGVTVSVVAAVAAVTADLYGRHGTMPTAVLAWNLVVQLGVFLALTLVLEGLRGRLEGEQLLARTDALTQMANRRAFFEAATLELERMRRHGRPMTLAYVDLDDFKFVNDHLGHAAGDALLVLVASTLRGATRAVDSVARLGGDEFGLLLPETDGPTAEALLGRLHATLRQAAARRPWDVGFSVGAATFLSPPASADQMMARADELMYEAKRNAKGSVRHAVFGTRRDGGPLEARPVA
jgi:diguanylate cyclase (GGDEF)-like protein